MDAFDDAILSVLQAANIDYEALRSFTRDDLKDLFPGHENFFRRKKLWNFIIQQPQTSSPISYTAHKTMKMPDPPEYVVYTDSELDMVRSQYFALLHSGKEKDCKMSKELCCRLIRNTVTSMVAILRASPMGKEVGYPSKLEMRAMSQKIVDYYPMLRDADTHMPYVTIYTKLYKRLQNMKSPRRKQDHDSLKMQARHYKTLSNMYKKPSAKPNQSDVAQILDLEFEARRAFIDADVTREEDRPTKIFEAYPCFKDIRNAMDELRRIVGGSNCKYIDQMKGRWAEFCSKVQFYGIWKKVLKPPLPLDVLEFTVTLFNALPSLFPSPTAPPKRLGSASEALLHILQPGEDAMLYLEKRPLSSPVLLFDGTTSIVAVGNIPVTTLPLEDFWEGMQPCFNHPPFFSAMNSGIGWATKDTPDPSFKFGEMKDGFSAAFGAAFELGHPSSRRCDNYCLKAKKDAQRIYFTKLTIPALT
ncbi:hypothetical protein ACER0C_002366 [Sarotherodon galilaeus]